MFFRENEIGRPSRNSFSGFTLVFIFLCFLVPICYSLYTNEIWEDSLITLRYAKNLLDGKGLVYNAGERVYGFTSPLGMLLLAFSYLVTGKGSDFSLFWFYRIFSILAFTGGGLYWLSLFSSEKKKFVPALFLVTLYIFDAQSIIFTADGMETAFMLFFIAAYLAIMHKGLPDKWISGGVCWAGLMWTRPDGCMYIAALALAGIIFSGIPRKQNLIVHLKMAALCAVIYLPWFIFAWAYYGSPVPHTILAKLNYRVPPLSLDKARVLLDRFYGPLYYYFEHTSWPRFIEYCFLPAGILSIAYWVFPTKDRFVRTVSLSCFFIFLYYFFFVKIPFPWYFPPLKLISSVVLAKAVFKLMHNKSKVLASVIIALFCSASIYTFVYSCVQMRVRQAVIEDGNRKLIGLWLKDHMRSQDRVFLEPFGYIGYYSESRIIDCPGLISPDVARLMREDRRSSLYRIVPKLNPEWLVLRDNDLPIILTLIPDYFRRNYSAVKLFDVTDRLRKYGKIPGIEFILGDASYVIFKKNRRPLEPNLRFQPQEDPARLP